MQSAEPIFLGKADDAVFLYPALANRHGLIAGATGTGKTVTLQVLAEGFSQIGVPVFLADVKGDLSGLAAPGGGKPKLEDRAEQIGLGKLNYTSAPVVFWDAFGDKGHPVRTTISEMGPLLLSRLLELNEVQEGVLNLTFKLADDSGLLLLDLKDLRAMLTFVAENASSLTREYGTVSAQSVGAIQRSLLVLEQQGADAIFGEPSLNIHDLMQTTDDGRGIVNVLSAEELFGRPRMYATLLLWLLSELFEELPEVGDPDRPKLVFFFDEAHLLFDNAPKALVEKVEQVVRLVRSKGVGVYFVTQNPLDVPDAILAQLGNRVQHALRAFTPRDQKAVKAAAETFRVNPAFKTAEAIQELGVGEALISTLDPKGIPTIVQRTLVRPPLSRLGVINEQERGMTISASPIGPKYVGAVDRVSAYEILQERAKRAAEQAEAAKMEASRKLDVRVPAPKPPKATQTTTRTRTRSSRSQDPLEAFANSVARSAGTQMGRSLIRGVLGGLFKGR